MSQAGEHWLKSLLPVQPIILKDRPVVMIIDGVSPDVWLETMELLKWKLGDPPLSWCRLEADPVTGPAVSALFGFSGDAMDEFSSRGIPYHRLKGDDVHGLADLLPPFPPDQPVVLWVALVDEAAHTERFRLFEMPEALCRFLVRELPGLQEICAQKNRRLILTTDHGLSLTQTGLSHGKGGVFERVIFKVEWAGK